MMADPQSREDAAAALSIAAPAARRRLRPGIAAGGLVFLIAFAARLIPVFWLRGIAHPDEVFQSIEQAHRLVYGFGVVPWEFDYGTRSWLLPGVIAGLMEAARLLGDRPEVYLPVIGMAFAALSAAAVLCAYLWGARFYGVLGGFVAAMAPALWIDCIYYGPRTLSEAVAAHLLVIATYLVSPDIRARSRWRLVAGGALFGLTVPIRIQLLPAVALVMLWSALPAWRQRLPAMVAGTTVIVVLAGALDAVTWSYPFESIWRNVTFNLTYGGSSEFGTASSIFYVWLLATCWGIVGVGLIMALVGTGALRLPIPLAAAGMILVSHALIPHKEARFIYPAILLLLITAGMGLAEFVAAIRARVARRGPTPWWLAPATTSGAVAGVALLSVGTATLSAPYRELVYRGNDIVRASRFVAHLADVCGIGTFDIEWWKTGGYTYFHRPVRFYWPATPGVMPASLAGLNTLVYQHRLPRAFDGFTKLQCFGEVCVAHRPGACRPDPMIEAGPSPAALQHLSLDPRRALARSEAARN